MEEKKTFSFCASSMLPDIPHVQDVLYLMRLSGEQKYFEFCLDNHRGYIVNVILAASEACGDVLSGPYDEAKARRTIARAILELCPEDAKCLFVGAYIDALETAGLTVPRNGSRADLVAACGCTQCRLEARWNSRNANP